MTEHNNDLPAWSKRFLKAICPDYLLEEIEGDLLQKFRFDIGHYGERRARKKLFWNIGVFFALRSYCETNFLSG